MEVRQAFELALRNFPKWMDIRKRKNRAVGAHFLRSMTDEAKDVEMAIEEMRKSFFASNYRGIESTVIDYLSYVNIGNIDTKKIIMMEPKLIITTDYNEFTANLSSHMFYENNILLVSYDLGIDKIKYSINGNIYESALNVHHTWNTIDEFALYSGIERLEGERNKELLSRVFAVFKNIPNSTGHGLKNAIVNELSNLTDITPLDIDIALLTEENIHKISGNGVAISEEIIHVDKDVFRSKVWDKSRWSHPFKELKYADHKWDEELPVTQDGTGQQEDLKVVLLSEMNDLENTDVEIDVYKKSSVQVQNYIKNNRTSIKIPLNLTRYKDELSPISIEYKVIAEDARELTEPVYVESYLKEVGEFNLGIDDIVIDRYDKEYSVAEGGALVQGTKYKVVLKPKDAYSRMGIEQILYKDSRGSVNHAVEKDGFVKVGQYLESERSAYYGDTISHLYASTNMKNVSNGITIADAALNGEALVDVTNIENKYLKYEVSCELTEITTDPEFVFQNGFQEYNNAWENRENDGDFIIEGIFSELTYVIEEGNVTIEKIINGNKTVNISTGFKEEKLKFDAPTEVRVHIKKIYNSGRVAIKNVKYSRYEVNAELTSGALIVTSQGVAIPRSTGVSRYLKLGLKTYTGFSPVLKYIYIGSTLSQITYETAEFTAGQSATLKIKSNCIAELVNITTGEIVGSYKTDTVYKNETNRAVYVEINASAIESIEDSKPAIITMSYKNAVGKFIKLSPGESISSIWIKGSMRILNERKTVQDIVAKSGEKVYISKHFKHFIVKGAEEKTATIKRSELDAGSNLVLIKNLPSDISCVFITDQTNNKEFIGTSHESFESIYFVPKNTSEYVMYENERMASKEIRNIQLINKFYPQLNSNKLVILRIDKGTNASNVEILFEETDKTFSVGFKKVKILADKDFVANQFATNESIIDYNFVLSTYMELPSTIQDVDIMREAAEFIIHPGNSFEVVYEKQSSGLESYYIKNDGFNKLFYSNILSVLMIIDEHGTPIDTDSYDILQDEGVIYWKDLTKVGEVFSIQYEYKNPTYIKVIDMDVLYDIVGYTVNTLGVEGTITYHGIRENKSLSKEERDMLNDASHYVVRSSNPRITATIDSGTIMLTKLVIEDDVLVKPGYFYASNKEWYYFVTPSQKEAGGMLGIDFNEVDKINNELILNQASVNYITSSNMLSDDKRKLFEYKITEREAGESTLNAITACDSYFTWKLFNGDIEIVDGGINGRGLKYKGHTDESYAVMEISEAVYDHCMVSLYASEKLACYIAKQTGDVFNKNIYCENITKMNQVGHYQYLNFSNLNKEDRYFLVIKGEGIIDDIVIGNQSNELSAIHTKTLHEKFFEIPEPLTVSTKRRLLFDKNFNTFNRAEIDDEGYVVTSTDLEWGLTKVGEINSEWNKGVYSNVDVVKDTYIRTNDLAGIYFTKVFELSKITNLSNFYVKINNLCFEEMKDFSINVLTSANEKDGYYTVGTERKHNVIRVEGSKMNRFVKLVIEIPRNKVIENIALFCEYREGLDNLRTRTYSNGEMISKVYDVGSPGVFQVKKVLMEDVFNAYSIYIRGIKQNTINSAATDWKELRLDESGNVTNFVTFEDYELFQFKISLEEENSAVKISGYELEVI